MFHAGSKNLLLQVRPLEMFFPFDPYLLRRSARFLDLSTSYNTWGGAHRHGTDASHVSSDDELEVPDGEIELRVSCLSTSVMTNTKCACLSAQAYLPRF